VRPPGENLHANDSKRTRAPIATPAVEGRADPGWRMSVWRGPEYRGADRLERVPQKWIRFCDQNALSFLIQEHDAIRRFRLIASCSGGRSS
jgi:hypothetical protein